MFTNTLSMKESCHGGCCCIRSNNKEEVEDDWNYYQLDHVFLYDIVYGFIVAVVPVRRTHAYRYVLCTTMRWDRDTTSLHRHKIQVGNFLEKLKTNDLAYNFYSNDSILNFNIQKKKRRKQPIHIPQHLFNGHALAEGRQFAFCSSSNEAYFETLFTTPKELVQCRQHHHWTWLGLQRWVLFFFIQEEKTADTSATLQWWMFYMRLPTLSTISRHKWRSKRCNIYMQPSITEERTFSNDEY